jgi:hypothetical protein
VVVLVEWWDCGWARVGVLAWRFGWVGGGVVVVAGVVVVGVVIVVVVVVVVVVVLVFRTVVRR